MVAVEVDNRSGSDVDERGAVALAQTVLAGEGIDEGELGISFVGPDEIRRLKRKHLGIDEETDVLSFPLDGRGLVDLRPAPVLDLDDDHGHRLRAVPVSSAWSL